ncbi:heavy metal translocating P-type ATPase [Levilactobacillus brevis]|uniref:Cd(2+)-exporting ATPase n=1 Tax=Levilactobacillus brevis TaxID=1580 RepID=A0AA41EQR7_LEVBR|nr:heavy metal translocating P-type ATPase [Levilactobacillus brevis]KID43974.1 Lead, cadmium, zinc and mercury transporting ATPase [Levilactobacillus brevis]MBS0948001.1 cadmium-translocating P-type ATPase [Levilactobacillus brevis]MBS0978373.1 cadmium-translocating P-type ATPase [Levilactobacillus brevis]MBS1011146.1 cadmium-translocating P-type ATPase [Levilactobacillus brevis]MCU0198984.1 heavy metal translocating P-type ATPase [Levilactobacillus brevis]
MGKLQEYKRFWFVVSLGVIALGLQFLAHQAGLAQLLVSALGICLALFMFVDMVKTLRSGKFGVDLLAITAVVATLAGGEYWAALIVLLMLTGGDALEDFAAQRANSELQTLLDQSPQTAHVVKGETVTDVAVNTVAVGAQLLVKPGEVMPVDGKLITGPTTVNEASLTGEARPIEKAIGDTVMSGSINGEAAVYLRAEQTAENSQYQNIVRLVKQAEAQPAKFVRMADRYAVPFTILAYVIAGVAWAISQTPVRFAEVLVVASPCPLILAAPIALISGMSRASRNGIIVKTGTTLEKLAQVKTVAFDKTGTITQGKLVVDQVVPQGAQSADRLLQLAASAEQHSSHVLAQSLVAANQLPLLTATDVTETTAQGVVATINGQQVRAGKAAFVTSESITKPDQTAVYVAVDDVYQGYVSFNDRVRPEAATTMTRLRQAGVAHLMMISGDRQPIAEQIAQEVGLDQVHAECLPAGKIAVLDQLAANQRPVAMVGDGINDAPSLATADVGIAMGAHGATAASESADAVVLKDDLTRVSTARVIAQDTMRVARQSVLIGIFICTGLMLIATTGIIPAIIGAVFQEVVDTVTILYALRARSDRTSLEN